MENVTLPFNKVPGQYVNKYSKEYGSLHTKFIDGINESIVRSEEDSSVGHHSVGSYSRANMLAPDFFRESDQVLTFVALCYVQC